MRSDLSPLGRGEPSCWAIDSTQRHHALIVQKAPQLPRPRRMLPLAQRLGLDLADALAGDRELLADLFLRVVGVHADAEAHAEHAFLARRQARQHARGALSPIGLARRAPLQERVLALYEY